MRFLALAAVGLSGCLDYDALLRGPDGATKDFASDLAASDAGGPTAVAAFGVTTSSSTVEENQQFTIHLTALDGTGAPVRDYAGTPDFASDWGGVRVKTPPAFVNGESNAMVALNRETGVDPAHIIITDGMARGQSPPITVTVPPWTVIDATPVLLPGPGWDKNFIRAPAWIRKDSRYYLYYYGQGTGVSGWGIATSTTGASWVKPVAPSIIAATTGWEAPEPVAGFRPVWDGTRFVAAYTVTFRGVGFATSDDGFAWTRASTPLLTGPSAGCPDMPVARALASEPGGLRIFLDAPAAPCTLTSSDGGATWSMPSPSTGFPGGWAGFVLEARRDDGVYRLWFAPAGATTPMSGYATSADGVSWTVSSSPNPPFQIDSVLWNQDLERFEAVFQENGGVFRATRR